MPNITAKTISRPKRDKRPKGGAGKTGIPFKNEAKNGVSHKRVPVAKTHPITAPVIP